MIGGALCEARGELFPGFVAAALNTPYRIRVPLAPAEGLVLESQVQWKEGVFPCFWCEDMMSMVVGEAMCEFLSF